MRRLFLLLGCVIGAGSVHAQPDLWAPHLSMYDVGQVAPAADGLWAASTGGVFRYAPATGTFERYTVTDGLSGVRAAAVADDPARGVVWIGYSDGLLDRLDPAMGTVRAYRDIARADQFSDRSVTRLRVFGDSLFVATAFGVVVFDPRRGEVRDTYSRLGMLTSGVAVRDVAVAPGPGGTRALWVSTEEGVAIGPLDGRNLQDPASWLDGQAGLPTTDTRGLAAFAGRLYVGTLRGVFVWTDGSGWADAGMTSSEVGALATDGTVLVAQEPFSLSMRRRDGSSLRVQPVLPDPYGFTVTRDVAVVEGAVYVADRRATLAVFDAADLAFDRFVRPPGPGYNAVADLAFGADGTLWTTGSSAGGEGFQFRTPGGPWTLVSREQTPDLVGEAGGFGVVEIAPDGTVWLGADGAGLLEIDPAGAYTLYGRHNSTLRTAVPTNPDFILVEGLAVEPDGTLWATNRFSAVPLHVRLPDGTWTGFAPFAGGTLQASYTGYEHLLRDGFGTLWITVRDERNQRNGRGLIVYDRGADPVSRADDAVRHFGEEGAMGSGLPGLVVTSLVEDREGRIWVGTDRGIAYLLNNGIAARDPASTFVWPVDPVQQAFVLRNLGVNALAVDPANGLWVGTDEGAWLVREREGGFEVAAHFTPENAPLPASKVLAVAVEPRTGEVFIATEAGMVSYLGGTEAPAAQVQDLVVYPNPVRLADGSAPSVTIRGLVEQTELRILTPDGSVVRRLDTRGGSVVWDGRDHGGRLVPSGMYLVVAVGRDGEGAAYGRIAVIR